MPSPSHSEQQSSTELRLRQELIAQARFLDGLVESLGAVSSTLGGTAVLERTAREREILQLLADGMSNADVAGKLYISQETVKSHVRHILSKLEADTRTHAVAIALRTSIID